MGGSGGGGGFPSGLKPDELRRQAQKAEDEIESEAFDTKVSEVIDRLLPKINRRDAEGLQATLAEVAETLADDIEGSIDLLFGGSVAKRTYVAGLSDVDALVILNKSELKGLRPDEVRSYFAKKLRAKYGKRAVDEGTLGVTLKVGKTDVQFLPALRAGKGLRVPGEDGRNWSPITNPQGFANKLSALNQKLSGKVVPAIKLAKSIHHQLPEKQRPKGYHTESLAIEVFAGYKGPKTTKAMLRHFFTEAPLHVSQPIKDSTGQSRHVDDYLGKAGSVERRVVSAAVGRIGRKMRNADAARSVEQWREILANF